MYGKFICFVLAFIAQAIFSQARYANINFNVGITVAEDSHPLSEELVRLCAEETDISMTELAKFRHNDFENQPPAQTTKCFTHCLYEQMGWMHDGVFVPHDNFGVFAAIGDPNLSNAWPHCHQLQEENKCERAFQIHQCMREARRKLHHQQHQQHQYQQQQYQQQLYQQHNRHHHHKYYEQHEQQHEQQQHEQPQQQQHHIGIDGIAIQPLPEQPPQSPQPPQPPQPPQGTPIQGFNAGNAPPAEPLMDEAYDVEN